MTSRLATPADVPVIFDLAVYEREPDAVNAMVDGLTATLFGAVPSAEAIIVNLGGGVSARPG